MFERHCGFQLVKQGFDDETFAQQDLVKPRHEIILHGLANASDEMQSVAPQLGEEIFADITLVGEEFSAQAAHHFFQWLTVIDIAATDLDRHDFAFVIDDDVKLEAEEPSHCRSSAFGQIFEHPVACYATIVAHRQLAAVGEINPCFFTFQAVQENCKWHQQLLHQRHKTGIAGCLAKQPGIFVFDAMLIEMLEVLVGSIVEHGHDQEPLGQ